LDAYPPSSLACDHRLRARAPLNDSAINLALPEARAASILMDAPSPSLEATTSGGSRHSCFGRRSTRSAARWLPILGLLLASGCDAVNPAADPTPATPPSPQTQLDHVMERLKDALDHAHAASHASVVSERQCAFRLIEPTAEGEPYQAEVVIQTSLGLKTGKKIKPIGEIVGAAPGAAAGEAKAAGAEDDPSFEKRLFKLVYKNQRWELAEPQLEELTETEKICFQSALSDG
jgi:hypothetical protein